MLARVTDSADGPRNENAWIDRARSGDRVAFDRLVELHLPRVWAVVWRMLRHREDAEDVVQEVFLTAYRGLSGYRGESRFSTWLHRIAVTRALNHLDRASEKVRRGSVALESVAEAEVEPVSGPPSPLQALEAAELRRRLAECLARLPSAWRVVLALRDGESLSYEEIAKTLGIALGTVRSRLARARLGLRRCVEEAGS